MVVSHARGYRPLKDMLNVELTQGMLGSTSLPATPTRIRSKILTFEIHPLSPGVGSGINGRSASTV